MKRRAMLLKSPVLLNTTPEKLLSIVEALLTSQTQLGSLLPSQTLEQLSTLGRGGVTSITASIDTLMQWYDTLPQKDKEKFWTLIVDFLLLATPVGMPSRERNSGWPNKERKMVSTEAGVYYDEGDVE